MANRLAGETSPYLLQHADNPVHWQPWGEQALAEARSGGKPILLSIGYSACHWCHVMAHESFEDEATAAVMNELFVNIKVDREERPDLDQIYQSAHQMLTGRPGGWPLTMFLTPDGTPFFGGTYFPNTSRHGLPAFADLCRNVADIHRQRPDDIAQQNRALREMLDATTPRRQGKVSLDGTPIRTARDFLLRNYDSRFGGFGGAPKFPHASDLALLLRLAREGDGRAREAALTTLTRMAEGGIFDQLGGGFCRYSVDERWEIPHFEKMLYDNGPLLGLYAEAWQLTREPLFARVVEETAGWAIREMQLSGGAFASSLDADSEGEEGRYYVWERDQIQALLTDAEWALARRYWNVDRPPNFEGHHWHLHVALPVAADDLPGLAAAKAKLLRSREGRVRPGRDDKVLTAWNALMIEGLARAGRIFRRQDWLLAARQALDYIRERLWQDGRLLATARGEQAHLAGYLDDYAFLLLAVQELSAADQKPGDAEFARNLAAALLEHFEDKADGAFHFTADDHETLIHRPKPGFDNSMPSGNGAAALALLRLAQVSDDAGYSEAAYRTMSLFLPQIARSGGGGSTMLLALAEALATSRAPACYGPDCAVPQEADDVVQAG